MYVCIVDVSYFFNTRKAEWGSFLSPNRFAKSLFSREREDEALLFVNFNIITNYISHKLIKLLRRYEDPLLRCSLFSSISWIF